MASMYVQTCTDWLCKRGLVIFAVDTQTMLQYYDICGI